MPIVRSIHPSLALMAAVAACGSARAAVTGVAGGTAAPATTLGPFTLTPFAADTVNPLFAQTTTIPSPVGTDITLAESLEHDQISAGWGKWSNGYTGDVYAVKPISSIVTAGTVTPAFTTVVDTVELPAGTGAFYLYMEPFDAGPYDMTATASDGATVQLVDQMPAGQNVGGADFYGFYASSGDTLKSVSITNVDPNGYAIGEFGIAAATAIPEPASLALFGLAAFGLLGRRNRRAAA